MAEVLSASGDVRQDLQAWRWLHLLQANEIDEPRYEAASVTRRTDEVRALIPSGDLSLEVDAPPICLLSLEAKL
jgi:hypothetical protein